MTTRVPAARVAELVVPLDDPRPAYAVLAERLRLLIVDGRIVLGARLPSERELTGALGISRTTVTRAYDLLRESGYAVARQGSGTLATLPTGSIRRGTGASLHPADALEGVIDLTCAATRAPAGLTKAYAAALDALPAYLAGAGYFTLGVPELREAIAARFTARGLPTTPDQVMVTSGAVAGIAIVQRALLRAGDRVLIENPTYPNTADSLRRGGARLHAIPVEAAGWDVPTIAATARSVGPRAAVLIPDFHNPTGTYQGDEQRAQCAAVLRRHDTVTIIDETIAEVRLDDGADALPFAAHLPSALTIGSASKSHWGGLRLGWIRADASVMTTLVDARVTVDLGAPVVEQLVLNQLLRDSDGMPGDRRADLIASRDAAVTAVRELLPDLAFTLPSGGLSLWLRLPGESSAALVDAAEQEGLLLAGGNRFAATGTLDHFLRLPHVLPPDQMREAVQRLAHARAATRRTPRHATTPARRGRPLVA